MTDKTGAARLRQAIKNQRDLGNGDLRLTYHDAEEIADEIDAELLGICSSAERETGRYAWAHGVPAPVDADGEVVPLDTTKLYTDKGEMIFVGDIRFDGYRWYVCGTGSGRPYRLKQLHRTGQDSWEKLEEDIQKVARTQDNCPSAALQDVMRRAKALAERDAKEADRG